MEETRSEKFSVNLTPAMLAALDKFAQENHWSRSTAAAILIERGLNGGSK